MRMDCCHGWLERTNQAFFVDFAVCQRLIIYVMLP